MKRILQRISIVFLLAWVTGCVSANQRVEEQQQLERSIRKTSNPDEVKSCSFLMKLRPDGLHSTPEAQAASLVIPRQGVSWIVFGTPGNYELYSCSQGTARSDEETKAETPAPAETKAAPAQPAAESEVITREQPSAKIEVPRQPKTNTSRTRVTNNPEAIKGCKFLESFAEYQKVAHFQEDVVRAGGNVGYIVAANHDGDVIGESYLCSEEARP